jgi:hypothetical protein
MLLEGPVCWVVRREGGDQAGGQVKVSPMAAGGLLPDLFMRVSTISSIQTTAGYHIEG